MRATRRRTRRLDPLASTIAIRRVLEELRTSLPGLIPRQDEQLIKLLVAVRNLYVRPSTDTRRGRPGRFTREDLLQVDTHLRSILDRETCISVRSFVGQYLPVLDFPRDVVDSLEGRQINLFEAYQLARLTARRLTCTEREARAARCRMLDVHLLSGGSGASLRLRVKELLGELVEPSATATEIGAVEKADDLLELDPLDSTHLFFEELRRIGRALRDVRPEDLSDEVLGRLLPLLDELGAVLHNIEQKRQKQQTTRLTV